MVSFIFLMFKEERKKGENKIKKFSVLGREVKLFYPQNALNYWLKFGT